MKKQLKDHIHFALGMPAILWQCLFFYLPLVMLIFTSFALFDENRSFLGLSFKPFAYFLKPIYIKVIASSLFLALTTAFLTLLFGYPLAYYMAFVDKKRENKRRRNFLLFLLFVPFLTNFLLHVYAWFFVLDKFGIINTILMKISLIDEPLAMLNTPFSILIMMVYFYLPFMVVPIYGALERFDVHLIEASLDLGANYFQTMKRVVIPLSLKGVKTGFFLVFIPACGEFAIPELMGGDKLHFIGNVASFFILSDDSSIFASPFIFLSVFALILTAFFFFLIDHFFFKKVEANENS